MEREPKSDRATIGADPMMRWFSTVLLSIGLCSPATASELNLPPGEAPMPDAVSFVFVGDPPEGVQKSEVEAAIAWSASEWDSVTCSTLEVAQIASVDTLDDVPQGAVPIFFVGLDAVCFPDRDSGQQSIAFTVYCDAYPSPAILLNRESYEWRSVPVPFQSVDEPQLTRPIVDLSSVIAHEMGHALRLPHIDDPIATMYARYRRDGNQATLSAADDLKLCELYGGGESECASDSDCSDGACLQDDNYGVCDTFRGETGAFCSWETLQCAEECFFSSPVTGTGYCTQTCSIDTDCPERMVCAETSNGTSLCQFDYGEAEPRCSSAGGMPLVWMLLVSLATLRRRRRR